MEFAPADAAVFVGVELAHQVPHIGIQVVHVLARDVDGQAQQQRPQLTCGVDSAP